MSETKKNYSYGKWVTLGLIVVVASFVFAINQLAQQTKEDTLSKIFAESFRGKEVAYHYIGKSTTYTLGNFHYYKVEADGKTYYMQTNHHDSQLVQKFDVTNGNADVVKQFDIVFQ